MYIYPLVRKYMSDYIVPCLLHFDLCQHERGNNVKYWVWFNRYNGLTYLMSYDNILCCGDYNLIRHIFKTLTCFALPWHDYAEYNYYD
jgi:hypothetical protein